jgi:hypothetical protein
MNEPFKPGDPIEVAFVTHDGPIWNEGKIVAISAVSIAVKFPGGRLEGVPRNDVDRYRVPKLTQPIGTTHQPSPLKTTRG